MHPMIITQPPNPAETTVMHESIEIKAGRLITEYKTEWYADVKMKVHVEWFDLACAGYIPMIGKVKVQ